jgi:osmotically-inducible protein OsmY
MVFMKQNNLNGSYEIEVNETEYFIPANEAPVDDATIKSTVIGCLIWFANVPLEDITVNVEYGYVSLNGMYQKHVIADMVKNLHGVKGIINNIRIVCKLSFPFCNP